MEAKDTIKTSGELCLIVCHERRELTLENKDCTDLDCETCQLKKQAEISFKAGRADERTKTLKKVAEWIEKNYFTGEYPTSHKLWLYKEALKKGEIPWTKK